jgi:predicted nuclease of restriction endonuclease-like (RecB) superfamily
MKKILESKYCILINDIGDLLEKGRKKAFHKVDNILVETYWNIGRRIIEFEQNGEERAEYGKSLLKRISKDLKLAYGKGFSRSNLQNMRLFYSYFPKCQTLSSKLSWSHYVEILSAENELERNFYIQQSINENWSVRELQRQIKSGLFERIALSKDVKGILELAKKGQIIESSNDLLKEPFVFEFLNLPMPEKLTENQLESQLIDNLEQFLLELGKGFAFIGRQYRISIDNTHFYVDLVFYHRILKCFVLIDLKMGKVNHQDIGQMNLYLNYFKKEENVENDNEPIGIILGAKKNDILVEYATGSISNQLFVSKYQLYLPDKKLLKEKLQQFINS